MRNLGLKLLLTLFLCAGVGAEEWKGAPSQTNISFAGMGGLAIVSGAEGFGFVGAVAFKVLNEGFIPDINDQVFIEAQAGPQFIRVNSVSTTAFAYGLFMRWNFHKNDSFMLYSMGGLGGTFTPDKIFPRVALGTVIALTEDIALRAEFSHEFLGAGIAVDLAI